MGVGRAFDTSLERLAVIRTVVAAGVLSAALSGCAVVGDITGAIAGLASGAATANPAVGIAVGVAVRAGTNEALDYVSRRRRQNEHDAIAGIVGDMTIGDTRVWTVDQRLAGDARGEVKVLRVIESSLAVCKELLFSVVRGEGDDARTEWFTTTACHDGAAWKWAAAEPAVRRWINLQ